MSKVSVNHLFPPDAINDLPSWRFVLHFVAPRFFGERALRKAVESLKMMELTAARFSVDLGSLMIDKQNRTVGVPIEVDMARRAQEGSIQDYESDFWKVCGSMAECRFGDVYYEAVDWKDEDE